ncbi:hypothetical protein EZS27_011280 [termite gut metagenome]|uniref:Uncharacterized protein n=1 Tax=termite gut metagenome TaxID=433724 RepID=A0A5J4S483_9ZZZZ
MNTDKMDISKVYTLFEEIKESIKQNNSNKPVESAQVDMTAANTMTERFENLIEEVKKPTKVEHRHVIDISSSHVFFSLIGMCIVILILSFVIYNQRQAISQYRDNDLKYRYVKMQGQMTEENIYQLGKLFENRDSIKIVRKQVERYERLVMEQAEKIEWARRNADEAKRLQREVESLQLKK